MGGRAQRAMGVAVALAGAALVASAFFPVLFPGTVLELAARQSFSSGCHQIAERSAHFNGHALALCHRCIGIVAGIGAGGVLVALGLRIDPMRRALWVLAVAPIAIHVALRWILPATDLAELRVVTGLVFGTFAGAASATALAAIRRPRGFARPETQS